MVNGDAHSRRVTHATSRSPQAVPVPLTRLIGRERELAAIRRLLLEPHLRPLTLVGPPGIGKTRLGLVVADQLSVEASAGSGPASIEDVFFVPLAPLREPTLVASAIAQALGIGEAGRQPVLDSVKAT